MQSLRLPGSIKSNRGRGWLPWTLFAAMTCVAGWLAFDRFVSSPPDNVNTQVASSVDNPPASAEVSSGTVDARINNSTSKGQGSGGPESASKTPAALTSPTPSSPVEGQKVVLESKGYVVARRQVLVSPQVSGRIVHLDLEEGMVVEKGRILAEVDDTEYQADFSRAKANLTLTEQRLLELETGNRPEEIAQAQAALFESEALLPQREADFMRLRQLHQSRASSQAEYELAESSFRSQVRRVEMLRQALKLMRAGPRKERIAAARAEVDVAKADLAKAQWRLDNCKIRAPISGTVLRMNAEEGNLVNPVAFNGSFSICEIADLADLEVDLLIQERDIARVFVDQECRIRADAFPDRTYTGHVSRQMPIADRARGAVPVRVKIEVPPDEEGRYLKPELGALVTFFGP